MRDYVDNIVKLKDCRAFLGGDNEDTPITPEAITNMQYLIDYCDEYNIPQPEIFPWAGGDGIQAEWEYEDSWYIELDCSSEGISTFFIKDRQNSGYENGINCNLPNIKEAFLLIKEFLENVVPRDFKKSIASPQEEQVTEDKVTPKELVEEQPWQEFRKSGFLWWINMILHTFGWAIVLEQSDDNSILKAYPAKVKYRGFSEDSNTRGYQRVSKYMVDNANRLYKESKDED